MNPARSDAALKDAVRGYGREKLMSEMFCQECWHERGTPLPPRHQRAGWLPTSAPREAGVTQDVDGKGMAPSRSVRLHS